MVICNFFSRPQFQTPSSPLRINMNQMKPDTGFGMAWVPLNLLGIGISAWMMYIPEQYAHFCPTVIIQRCRRIFRPDDRDRFLLHLRIHPPEVVLLPAR
jgi:hypothetical protein